MRTLYLDCFAGVSGDMFIGMLIDLGVELNQLEQELNKLAISGYHLHCERVMKTGLEATSFKVYLDGPGGSHLADSDFEETQVTNPQPDASDKENHQHDHSHHDHTHHEQSDHGHPHQPHTYHDKSESHEHHGSSEMHSRSLGDILELVQASKLASPVKERITRVFHRLGAAEARVHGKTIENNKEMKLYAEGLKSFKALPEQEREALKDYTLSSYGHMNNALRFGTGSKKEKEEALSAAKGITKASIPLPEGMLLTRRHDMGTSDLISLSQIKPGTVLQDPGIISTSTSSTAWSGRVECEMTVGPGVKGLPAASFSYSPGEREVILPPNTRMVVTSIETINLFSQKPVPVKDADGIRMKATILPFHEGQCCPP